VVAAKVSGGGAVFTAYGAPTPSGRNPVSSSGTCTRSGSTVEGICSQYLTGPTTGTAAGDAVLTTVTAIDISFTVVANTGANVAMSSSATITGAAP